MGKIVDGKDELIGTLDFHADFAAHTLTGFSESGSGSRLTWSLTWSGAEMSGTLTSSAGQVIRKIRLKRVIERE